MASPFSFSVKLTRPPEEMLRRAEKLAKEKNVVFSGDASLGTFRGRGVEGEYRVEGDTVQVTIVKKPLYVTRERIKRTVEEFFR